MNHLGSDSHLESHLHIAEDDNSEMSQIRDHSVDPNHFEEDSQSEEERHSRNGRTPMIGHFEGNNPYRQFSVAIDDRNFQFAMELRNGYTLWTDKMKRESTYSPTMLAVAQRSIWSWFVMDDHPQIPMGSKLIAINHHIVSNDQNVHRIHELIRTEPLPIILIFEAPQYIKTRPRSTHIRYQHGVDTLNRTSMVSR